MAINKNYKRNGQCADFTDGINVPTLHSALETDLSEKEVYDLLMMQFIMDGGYAARFEKSLFREQGLLASVVSYYDSI